MSNAPIGMSNAPTAVRCHQLTKRYAARAGVVDALDDVTFHVRHGEFVCLVGPSGCGKSTVLKLLARLISPTSGTVTFGNGTAADQLPSAMVFQEHGLFPWMTLLDNVAYGLEMRGIGRRERHAQARDFLAQVGLHAFANHFPHQLSVGMRQRAAIARAFLSDPGLLLMDEPFSALDAQSKLVLQDELLRIWKDHRKTVVYVTHDIEEAVLLGDRVLVMSGRPGRIQAEFDVPLARPRDIRNRNQPAVRDLSWRIWKNIESEVRNNLALPTANTP